MIVLRRLARFAAAALIATFALLAALLLAIRFVLFPNVDAFRGTLVDMLAGQLGQPVEIDAIDTGWDGWNPKLRLRGFRVFDRARAAVSPQLELPGVDLVVSWTSLPTASLRLRELVIERPRLAIRRDRGGLLHLGGLEFDPAADSGDSSLTDWILAQRRIIVRDALVTWNDDLRNAPQLVLDRVELRLENSYGQHRFGLTGVPPPEVAAPIDLRGEWRGQPLRDWRDARGRMYLRLDYADAVAWREWLPFPVAVDSGKGALRLWFEFADGVAQEIVGDIELTDVRARLEDGLPMLALSHLAGRIGWRDRDGRREVFARDVVFTAPDGSALAATTFRLALREARDSAPATALLEFDRLQLDPLRQVAAQLPLPGPMRVDLARYAPSGTLVHGRLLWEGPRDRPLAYAGSAEFIDLGITPQGVVPGGSGYSGRVEFTQLGGALKLRSRAAALELPRVFQGALAFDQLDSDAHWEWKGSQLVVKLDRIEFANAHATGRASGVYRSAERGPGTIDLEARLKNASLTEVHRYLPRIVGDETREWLRLGLIAGRAPEATLRLAGDLAEFPFVDGKRGKFEVVVKAKEATLDYADGWPRITGIDATVRFSGAGLVVDAVSGSVFGARIQRVQATIPDLGAWYPQLRIDGQAAGPTADFVRFVGESPVDHWIGGVTQGLQASGGGRLDLGIDLVLGKAGDDHVAGEFAFVDSQLRFPDAPALTKVNGSLAFTESTLTARDIAVETLGGPAKLALGTAGERLRLTGSGTADVRALQGDLPGLLADRLSGTLPWTLAVDLGTQSFAAWTIDSSGVGLAVDLPAPLRKRADEPLPLRISRHAVEAVDQADSLVVTAGPDLRVVVDRRLQPERAEVTGIVADVGARAIANARPRADRRGIWVNVDVPALDLDQWLEIAKTGSAGAATSGDAELPPLRGFELAVGALEAFGGRWQDIRVAGQTGRPDLRLTLGGPNVEGVATWSPPGAGHPNGRLVARLARLAPGSTGDKPAAAADTLRGDPSSANAWPELDIEADVYASKGRDLGRLVLAASPAGGEWRIHRLRLAHPSGTLDASGVWRSGDRGQQTTLDVELDVADAAAYLGRLGYPDAVQGAPTRITGALAWDGAPNEFDYPSLSGRFRVDVGAGRFTRLDPGIGKLLGVLSLQALPRRITLDFRDVFSEGFAFDRISGSVRIEHGLLMTDDLQLAGPAAKVSISGVADIAQETQRLRVRVQPTLSAGVSAGAALLFLANPLVGAAVGAGSLLAQKMLEDPVEQMFSYEYRITGGWSDPVVTRGSAETAIITQEKGTP